LIEVPGVLVLFAGAVITTAGTLPRITLIVAVLGPNALVQVTVTVLLPMVGSETELVPVLLDAPPLTVQAVPTGMVVDPSTV